MMNAEEKPILVRMVRTNTICFITDRFKNGSIWNNGGRIEHLLFDGVKPKQSFKPNWFVIDQYPTKIQREVKGGKINERWEINDKDMVSAKLPQVIRHGATSFFDDDGHFLYGNLYTYMYDNAPNTFEDVQIEWEMIMDVDDFQYPPNIRFSGISRYDYKDSPYIVNNASVKHQALDEMIFPEVLLHNRPSSFDSTTVYNITRHHILENIDTKYAEVSSNYDFCFQVNKLIPLYAPQTITYQNIFAKTKRDREKRYTTIKAYDKHKIFEMTTAEKRYQGYTPIPPMFAASEEELQKKMESWLEMLMEEINRPLYACPHCKGAGYTVADVIKPNYV